MVVTSVALEHSGQLRVGLKRLIKWILGRPKSLA